ncbi:MAG TPA: hypothetical protein VL360_02005 [Gammaproteobacteria bacterium]|nr:hypothetical protein [Gammaproteobacteria bacterium]
MSRHSMIIIKDGKEVDKKHTKAFNSNEELDAAFEAAKTKYNAAEDKSKQTTMGTMGAVGLFKFANGECRHGKKVEIQYNIVENAHTCPKI